MTVTGQGLSPQPFSTLGMGSHQGTFSPAFPHPMGAEQIPGAPQSQAFQPSIWPQPAYAWQAQYGMPTPAYGQQPPAGQAGNSGFAPFPTSPSGSAQPGTGQPQQQPISELVAQILPLAQQVILPQVIAVAVPLIQQLITQQAGSQQFGQPNWGQQGTGSFVPGTRQYAGVS
jgi:hypothetical protein